MSDRITPHKAGLLHIQVPFWLMRRSEVSAGAKICYGRLALYANEKTHCWPGQEALAAELGVTVRQVCRYTTELERHELIETEKRGLGRTQHYHFLKHRWMSDQDKTYVSGLDRTHMSGPIVKDQRKRSTPPVTVSSKEETSSSGREEEEEDLFLSDLKAFYAGLPAGLRSDLKVFDKYVAVVHESGEQYTRVDLRLCTGLANEIAAAFEGYPGDWNLLTFPEPAPAYLNGLQEAAQAVRKHRPGKHALRSTVENLLEREGDVVSPLLESWPSLLLKRIAQQPALFSEKLIEAQQDAAKQVAG